MSTHIALWSEKSAEVLYENADGIFTELSNLFGLLHTFRLPVVISPAQDEFNAYYSSAPFSHIVMYDTVPPESFAVFSETLLSTFRHELIHAVTYNLHNNFWTKVKKIGGDTYNPALLTITSGWAEGASVSVESSGGEGRLNSEYHKQLVRQAKIEGKFPRFSEVQGARDVYPVFLNTGPCDVQFLLYACFVDKKPAQAVTYRLILDKSRCRPHGAAHEEKACAYGDSMQEIVHFLWPTPAAHV